MGLAKIKLVYYLSLIQYKVELQRKTRRIVSEN